MLIDGMNIAAVMVLIPRNGCIIDGGLMPISEMTQAFLEKRFPGKELYIGLDAAVATGHPFVISLALLAIPIIYIEAIILPWNTVLPLTDLAALVSMYNVLYYQTEVTYSEVLLKQSLCVQFT